jgi:hypothetical protein
MKSCGRRLKTTGSRCGTLFEGSGAYCRDCRNEYQKEYYARRKEPMYIPATEKTGGACQACSTALRSNTVAIVDVEGLESTVVLCETCRAIVTYLSETVDDDAATLLVELATEIANLKAANTSKPTPIKAYVPEVTLPPKSTSDSIRNGVEMCLECEVRPRRATSAFCGECGV